jgi:dual specificity MAP kinase phosphatase
LDPINTDPSTQEPKETDQLKPACFSPPLLTSTFRPKDLLRKIDSRQDDKLYHRSGGGNGHFSHSKRKDTKHSRTGAGPDAGEIENEWEFVPARVPDGISLRSFGIQVVSLTFSLCTVLSSCTFSSWIRVADLHRLLKLVHPSP